MTECARCGDCCESFPLNTPERADIYGRRMLAEAGRWGAKKHQADGQLRKLWAWLTQLEVISGPDRIVTDDGTASYRWRYRCPIFDSETRLCGDHSNRPPVCTNFPFYGRDPGSYKSLPPRCSFIADTEDVKLLPIVEVR